MKLADSLKEKIKNLKLIALDIDGTMTDGGLYILSDGKEMKRFDVRDGFAIVAARKKGIIFAIISGRESKPTLIRARELGIETVLFTTLNKKAAIFEISKKYSILTDQIAFMGDDLLDIEAMESVGVSVTVADADPKVKRIADIITKRKGGEAAVREFIDILMKLKNINYL